ncbi:MAG: hypothetical protein ACPGVN_05755 [Alphaproteobacteria bacterium]
MRFFGTGRSKINDKDMKNWTSPFRENGTVTMSAWQTYYHLFFIPLVPSDKDVKLFCKSSKQEIRLDIPPEAIEEVRQFHKSLSAPLWMYSGFPGIVAVLYFLTR